MDLFQISSIIIFVASLGFGFFVYTNNRAAALNRAWLFFSAFVGFWGLALYGVTSAADAAAALNWQYALDVVASFIPVFYLYFVSTLLSLENRRLRAVVALVGAGLALFTLTPLFKSSVTQHFGFFWIEPGPYYLAFPIFFAGIILYSLYLLVVAFRQSKEPLLHSQIKYLSP
ncbi:hypothetical protein KW797_04960, partial [Candidatus Parcubacteria bacterium]|nr:hypothetical protein [Candidatus Parcubacteria bacterium]